MQKFAESSRTTQEEHAVTELSADPPSAWRVGYPTPNAPEAPGRHKVKTCAPTPQNRVAAFLWLCGLPGCVYLPLTRRHAHASTISRGRSRRPFPSERCIGVGDAFHAVKRITTSVIRTRPAVVASPGMTTRIRPAWLRSDSSLPVFVVMCVSSVPLGFKRGQSLLEAQ